MKIAEKIKLIESPILQKEFKGFARGVLVLDYLKNIKK